MEKGLSIGEAHSRFLNNRRYPRNNTFTMQYFDIDHTFDSTDSDFDKFCGENPSINKEKRLIYELHNNRFDLLLHD
jgi:hypothetical protein